MPKYYAVRDGREPGVYNSWNDCKSHTDGYCGSQFKSFNTAQEAKSYMSGGTGSGSNSGSAYSGGSGGLGGSGSYSSSGSSDRYPIYTDGSCERNGQSGAQGGYGVYLPNNPDRNVSEPLTGRQTNNRAEMEAARRGLQVAKELGHHKVVVNTDSNQVVKVMTEWMPKWERNGYKNVVNKQEFQALEREAQGMDVQWRKVAAHQGIEGNEKADQLARDGARKPRY